MMKLHIKVRFNIYGLMVISIMASGKILKYGVKEKCNMQMVTYMMGSGKMACLMDLGYIKNLMEHNMKDFGKKIKGKEKVRKQIKKDKSYLKAHLETM